MNPQEQNNQYAQVNDPNNPQQTPLPQQDMPPQQPMGTPPEVIGQPVSPPPQTIQTTQPQQTVYGAQQPPMQPPYGPQQPQTPIQPNPYDYLPKNNRFKSLFSSKKKIVGLVGTIVSVLVTISFLINFVLPRFQTIDLETFSNESVSILAPKDYDKKDEVGGFTFTEKGDNDTQSTVLIVAEKLPDEFKNSDAYNQEFFKAIEASAEQSFSAELAGGNTLKEFKVEKTQFKGGEARLVTADIMDDSKYAGKMKMYFGITKGYFYYAGVAVHAEDYGLEKSTDKIFDSIEFK